MKFTKMCEVLTTKSQRAHTVADMLIGHVFSQFGPPTIIHSDQGRNFESHLMQGICMLMGNISLEPLFTILNVIDSSSALIELIKTFCPLLLLTIRMTGICGRVLLLMRITQVHASLLGMAPMS